MTKYQIPEVYLDGFRTLTTLSKDEVFLLSESLKKLPTGAGVKAYEKILEGTQASVETVQAASSVFSLGGLLVEGEFEGLQELAESVANSVWDKNEEKSRTQLKQNLVAVLEKSENLKRTFKTYRIFSENPNTYRKASLVTNVRYVFDDELKQDLNWGVIIHQMKFEYFGENRRKEFFLHLDHDDIIHLKKVLDRALEKEEQIKSKNSNITFIEIEE